MFETPNPQHIESDEPSLRYNRGRAYVAHVASAAMCAFRQDDERRDEHLQAADLLLWPLGDMSDAEHVRDFVAGAHNEVEKCMRELREHAHTYGQVPTPPYGDPDSSRGDRPQVNSVGLLTGPQVEGATRGDLIATMGAIEEHLRTLDDGALLALAKDVLLEHGVFDGLRITFGTDEWDNGYFYSDVCRVQDAAGTDVELSARVLDALCDELAESLTNLSHTRSPLGRFATISIDLERQTVYSDTR